MQITNVDQLVLILRQRLLDKSRSDRAGRSALRSPQAEPHTLQALAALEGVDERSLRRALLQRILSDQFGSHLINEARFQQLVDQVAQTLEADPDGKALLDRVVSELKYAAR